jgi:hypothetical protein
MVNAKSKCLKLAETGRFLAQIARIHGLKNCIKYCVFTIIVWPKTELNQCLVASAWLWWRPLPDENRSGRAPSGYQNVYFRVRRGVAGRPYEAYAKPTDSLRIPYESRTAAVGPPLPPFPAIRRNVAVAPLTTQDGCSTLTTTRRGNALGSPGCEYGPGLSLYQRQ